MKILSILLCLTITVQLFIFCADTNIGKKEIAYISYKKQVIPDHFADRLASDLCSPFCQCTCCATPTVSETDPYMIQLALTLNTPFKDIDALGFIDISLPIWQPPQSA